MAANTFGTKVFKPIAPDKGSFPLDHKGECKKFMIEYMFCLHNNENKNEKCRIEAKKYFDCRMQKDLMDKEEWSKLGYADLEKEQVKSSE